MVKISAARDSINFSIELILAIQLSNVVAILAICGRSSTRGKTYKININIIINREIKRNVFKHTQDILTTPAT